MPVSPREVYRALHAVYNPAGTPHSPVTGQLAQPKSAPASGQQQQQQRQRQRQHQQQGERERERLGEQAAAWTENIVFAGRPADGVYKYWLENYRVAPGRWAEQQPRGANARLLQIALSQIAAVQSSGDDTATVQCHRRRLPHGVEILRVVSHFNPGHQSAGEEEPEEAAATSGAADRAKAASVPCRVQLCIDGVLQSFTKSGMIQFTAVRLSSRVVLNPPSSDA